ncbi:MULTISPECIES: hypothetical protein [Bacillus]|uniref:Phr family secreted Rap phosphatase inhibitor n=1 Tax=Bacillus capparidis TaxID=1840411 RepID=A0ABS4CWA0_9BACI|nr:MULTISPECIES: hypothetical protein [Bacillus]MBP1081864.1 hypothetical protein [Bacillus capparidis]MED1096513.1 hypothetical protein [Bacillus capparidis]
MKKIKNIIATAAIITAIAGTSFIVNQDKGTVIAENPITYSVDSYA